MRVVLVVSLAMPSLTLPCKHGSDTDATASFPPNDQVIRFYLYSLNTVMLQI